MSNLLHETERVLKVYDKKLEDALWIGSKDGYINLNTFKKLANARYDSGFGGQEVAIDLVIVGEDFYMTRGEYDGSEWWDYHSYNLFKKPTNELNIKTLFGRWDDLISMIKK